MDIRFRFNKTLITSNLWFENKYARLFLKTKQHSYPKIKQQLKQTGRTGDRQAEYRPTDNDIATDKKTDGRPNRLAGKQKVASR